MNETQPAKQPIWTNAWACAHYENWMKHLGKFVGRKAAGLEIGSCEGRSSCFFVQNILTHEESTLDCIDPFYMKTKEAFLHNVEALGCRGKINLHELKSDETAFGKDGFDFVYVDGLHTAPAVMKDAVRSWVALKKGGILILDDVLWHINDLPRVDCPKMAIDAFLEIFQKEMKVLHYGMQAIIEKVV